VRKIQVMYRYFQVLAIAFLSVLFGCASAPTSPLPRSSADSQGEVIIFREHAFAASLVDVVVSSGESRIAVLSNNQKASVALPLGPVDIAVQARSAQPTKAQVLVKKETPVCLRTSASPSTYPKAVVFPVLIVTGYHFYLDEIPCPPPAELSKYKDVPVVYQP
jgi:hypothetical protein